MSTFYEYNFVSPEPIFAIVQEELKSYMDTGAVDNLMFPTYLNKCLEKLGRATYPITGEVLYIENFEARLPDNFHAVKEAWMCSEMPLRNYQDASSFYSQAASQTTILITPLTIGGTQCNNPQCYVPQCQGTCMPELIQAVYKTNNSVARAFRQEYLLSPGNISSKGKCDVSYTHNFTPNSSSLDSFDVRDNKFVTNFRKGVVHLLIYALEYDNIGGQLVPDNFRVKEYIEKFIKYKIFEILSNQITDETFNQLQQKMIFYKQESDEAYIIALTEIKKPTVWQIQRKIKRDLNRHNMYQLPNSSRGNGWRRN